MKKQQLPKRDIYSEVLKKLREAINKALSEGKLSHKDLDQYINSERKRKTDESL